MWGLERGYCLMIGAPEAQFERLDPVFKSLAPGKGTIPDTPKLADAKHVPASAQQGYLHCGPVGAGHFVKMIHNGIEYGLMQAYAEGFDILRGARGEKIPADHRYELNLAAIAELWRRGSVVSSWLLDLTAAALDRQSRSRSLQRASCRIPVKGAGRFRRRSKKRSRRRCWWSRCSRASDRVRSSTFGEKLLSAMREQFGGHAEPSKK